jgi:alginate O-acetyltransferase complex protein AlgJ
MLMGDSFTGVFELVDCKSAGVGSHVAAKTGLPVDIITSWGGGPLVREKMLRGRAKNMGEKRVIVYMMVSRDLYNYAQGWAPLPVQ